MITPDAVIRCLLYFAEVPPLGKLAIPFAFMPTEMIDYEVVNPLQTFEKDDQVATSFICELSIIPGRFLMFFWIRHSKNNGKRARWFTKLYRDET